MGKAAGSLAGQGRVGRPLRIIRVHIAVSSEIMATPELAGQLERAQSASADGRSGRAVASTQAR